MARQPGTSTLETQTDAKGGPCHGATATAAHRTGQVDLEAQTYQLSHEWFFMPGPSAVATDAETAQQKSREVRRQVGR